MFDVVIQNSIIVDGTGAKPYAGDIAIQGDKIAFIAPKIAEPSETTINARGLPVSPGFIDVHSHTDLTATLHPSAERALRQGITTEVTGNCGLSAAPLSEKNREYWGCYMAYHGQGDRVEVENDWGGTAEFLDRLSAIRLGTNIAYLIGHNTLRSCVMGVEGGGGERRDPTEHEMTQMKRLLREGLDAGAFGFSTGLSYPAGRNASTMEVTELCHVVADRGKVYASHLRHAPGLQGYDEFLKVLTQSQVRGLISHVRGRTVTYPENGGRNVDVVDRIIEKIVEARRRGLDVYLDVIPIASGLNSLVSVLFGGWGLSDFSVIFDDDGSMSPLSGFIEKLRDPSYRRALRRSIDANQYITLDRALDTRIIHYCKGNPRYEGMTVTEVAEHINKDTLDTIIELLVQSEGDTRWGNTCIEEDLVKLFTMTDAVPCTDGLSMPAQPATGTLGGIPGPRIYGSFPYFIEKYGKLLPLQEVVRRMTSLPAQIFGVEKRGLVKPGCFADLVVFDPAGIRSNASYDEPFKPPSGVRYVIQNGVMAVEGGKIQSLSGKVLRKHG